MTHSLEETNVKSEPHLLLGYFTGNQLNFPQTWTKDSFGASLSHNYFTLDF